MTREMLMVQAKNFLGANPVVVAHLNRKQRRKVAQDLVKRLLKETRENDRI
jgi:precorrin-2 methylase